MRRPVGLRRRLALLVVRASALLTARGAERLTTAARRLELACTRELMEGTVRP